MHVMTTRVQVRIKRMWSHERYCAMVMYLDVIGCNCLACIRGVMFGEPRVAPALHLPGHVPYKYKASIVIPRPTCCLFMTGSILGPKTHACIPQEVGRWQRPVHASHIGTAAQRTMLVHLLTAIQPHVRLLGRICWLEPGKATPAE